MKMLTLLTVIFIAVYAPAFAQGTLSGRITDGKDGSPVAGASVSLKGSKSGTATGADGSFSITAPLNSVLVISAVGFSNSEIVVTTYDRLNISLSAARSNLQEIVVTGYTIQNKRQITGSVSKLNGDEVSLQPIGSFDQALQGKIPGLLSQSQSGQPGAAAVVTIRGKGSINGSNTPLYIIDGIEVNAEDFPTINPLDIESYTVLKDASSTSIYGSRGANGVIVITTKRGAAGKTVINYDLQYGYSELPKNRLKLMNSAEKLDYEINYDRPDGKNPFGWTDEQVDSLGRIDNNILGVLFRKAITQQHQLSASGGNERTRFYLSGSMFDQQGVVRTTGLKRYTGRANIENNFGNFKIGLNATLGYSRLVGTRENDAYVGSPLNAIRWFNPYITLYDENGDFQDDFIQDQPNPLRELLANKSNADQVKGVGSAFVEFRVPWVTGLRARTLWGADYTSDETMDYLDRSTNSGSQSIGGNGELKRGYAKTFRYTGTTSLSYQRNIGDHEINASLFNEIIQSRSSGFGFTGFGLVGPFKNEAGITPGSSSNGYIPAVTGNAAVNGLLSYFLDAGYGYKKRYFFSAGVRRDGSSRFGKNNKYANFGQVGASWIISDENFLQPAGKWLSELKVKSSYGSVGNQLGIGSFSARELLDPSVYNGRGGLLLANLVNPNLRWEKKLLFNAGIEFAIFDNRISGTAEFYNSVTKDLFLDRQLSRTSGFASLNTNLGSLQNQGIEFSLNAALIKTSGFAWSVSFNYAHNKNTILSQPGQPENINGIYINKEGERANSIYLVRYAGVDPQTGNSLYFGKDGKSTSDEYDPSDAVIAGTIDPPNYGGFSTELSYKGLELGLLFSYAYGNVAYNNDLFNVTFPGYYFSNLAASMLGEWQKPGDITDVPNPFNDFHESTTRYVEKVDYLRLRNVMLSYTLPASLSAKYHIGSLRVFAQGQNLHVWHHFQGYDPEITTGSLVGAQYPQLKTFTFGLNIGL